jgi:hypothetical protein
MIRTWGLLWPPWPQISREREEEKEVEIEEDESPSTSSAPGKELSKEEEIKGKIELLSHNVEMDRMFNRG